MLVLVVLGCGSGTALASPGVRLHVCYDNTGMFGPGTPGLTRVVARLTQVLTALDRAPPETRVGTCESTNANPTGCQAIAGAIACRADDIGHMLLMTRFADLLHVTGEGKYQQRRAATGSGFPVDAVSSHFRRVVRPGTAGWSPGLLTWLGEELGYDADGLKARSAAIVSWLQSPIVSDAARTDFSDDAVDLILEFVLGHELFHAHGEACKEAETSRAEDRKLWSFAVASMSNQALFCQQTMASNELRADLCGLRRVRHGSTAKRLKASGQPAAMAAELAADVIAFTVMSRHGSAPQDTPDQHLSLPLLKDYLHPTLRALLVAEEIVRTASKRRALCDRTARWATVEIQKVVKACPQSKGDVDDLILAGLPPTVVAAWQGGAWSDQTFWCPATP